MIVATFLSSALGTTVIPYRSYLTAMVGAFSKILGTTMNGAMYIIYAFCFMLVFMLLILLVMKFVLRVDMSKLEKLDTQALAKGVGKINLTGKLLLIILGIVILGIIYPLVIKSGAIYDLLSKTLTNNLFFGLAAVATCMIHVQGKPLMDINKAIGKYVPWGLLFSMGIMLFFADCLSSADSGVREFLSLTMGNLFSGMASLAVHRLCGGDYRNCYGLLLQYGYRYCYPDRYGAFGTPVRCGPHVPGHTGHVQQYVRLPYSRRQRYDPPAVRQRGRYLRRNLQVLDSLYAGVYDHEHFGRRDSGRNFLSLPSPVYQ